MPLFLLYFYRKEFSKFISYKLKYVFGYLGSALLISAIILKILHWPGSDLVFLISLPVIYFGYLPFLFYRIYNKPAEEEQSVNGYTRLNYAIGYLAAALFITAAGLKMMHWPGSATTLILSIVILNFGFLPFFFYRMYRKSLVWSFHWAHQPKNKPTTPAAGFAFFVTDTGFKPVTSWSVVKCSIQLS